MKRQHRLRHNVDFQRVRRNGKSNASPLMVLAFLRNELDCSRFGFVVSKRLGKAVQRNRIKRRMREATRLQKARIKPGFDLVFIARQPIQQASYSEIERLLEQLLQESDLLVQGSRVTNPSPLGGRPEGRGQHPQGRGSKI